MFDERGEVVGWIAVAVAVEDEGEEGNIYVCDENKEKEAVVFLSGENFKIIIIITTIFIFQHNGVYHYYKLQESKKKSF